MEWMIALVALTVMEIVLGIDNIVFLAIATGKLPLDQRPLARRVGLVMALFMRIALLCAISFIMKLTMPAFHLTDVGVPNSWFAAEGETVHVDKESEPTTHGDSSTSEATGHGPWNLGKHPEKLSYETNKISWRDLILIAGGLFLIRNSVLEIHEKLEHHESEADVQAVSTFTGAIIQIMIMDLIFSLDSVITAVGMADDLRVMIAAMVVAVSVMLVFANAISDFVGHHPTMVMLALSFLILIGVMLVAEGVGTHVDKGYIYFAMAFSLIVEMLNMRLRVPKTRNV